jgi:hypothetical protein
MRIKDMGLSPEAEREVYRLAHKNAAEFGRKLQAEERRRKKAAKRRAG